MPNRLSGTPAVRPTVARTTVQPAARDATAVSTRGWEPRQPVRPARTPDFPELPRTFEKSADGTPLFKQADPEWHAVKLGKATTIGKSGCAMTCVAMALSKLSGETITPKALDAWLDKNHGYAGDSLNWARAGQLKGQTLSKPAWSLDTLDANLAAGKPVVIGVDYKKGSKGGANGTDHWILLTGKKTADDGSTRYLANDPGTGKAIELSVNAKGQLVGDGTDALGKYTTTGQAHAFE